MGMKMNHDLKRLCSYKKDYINGFDCSNTVIGNEKCLSCDGYDRSCYHYETGMGFQEFKELLRDLDMI